ncbi:MAG TPA: hypothetical protein VKF82_00410 [Candidatus Eremiobacteraceae bacterium]|nr:hypothetical protein [Candidatus Eremiobacteraceae bacterium]
MFERDDLLARLIRGTVAGIAVFATVGVLAASARPVVVGHHRVRAMLTPQIQLIAPAGRGAHGS